MSISELKEKYEKGDKSICKKILYFSDTLRVSVGLEDTKK